MAWKGWQAGACPVRPLASLGITQDAIQPGEYDDEWVVVLDDWVDGTGRTPGVPATLTAKPGQRVRIRIINTGSDTAFRLALGSHWMTVTHSDGFPVEPVNTDALRIGMGERDDGSLSMHVHGHNIYHVEGGMMTTLSYEEERRHVHEQTEYEGIEPGGR